MERRGYWAGVVIIFFTISLIQLDCAEFEMDKLEIGSKSGCQQTSPQEIAMNEEPGSMMNKFQNASFQCSQTEILRPIPPNQNARKAGSE